MRLGFRTMSFIVRPGAATCAWGAHNEAHSGRPGAKSFKCRAVSSKREVPEASARRAVALVAALPLRTRSPAAPARTPRDLCSPTLCGAAHPQAGVDDLIDLIRRARRRHSLPNLHNIQSMARCLSP